MENAHLRMGILEYDRQTEKTASRVRVRVSHYNGGGRDCPSGQCIRERLGRRRHYGCGLRTSPFSTHIPRWNHARGHFRRGCHLLPRRHQHSGKKADCPAHDCTVRRDTGPEFLVANISAATGCNRGMDGDRSPARPSCNPGLGRSHDEGAR